MSTEHDCSQCSAKDFCSINIHGLPVPFKPSKRHEALDGFLDDFDKRSDATLASIREHEDEWMEIMQKRRGELANDRDGEEPSRRLLTLETARIFQLPAGIHDVSDRTCPGKKFLEGAAIEHYNHGFSMVFEYVKLADRLEEERNRPGVHDGLPESVLRDDPTGFTFIGKYLDCLKMRWKMPLRQRNIRYTLELAGAKAGQRYYEELYHMTGKLYPKIAMITSVPRITHLKKVA